MRTNFDGHNALVNYSRRLGTYAQTNHFLGWDILNGVKVSRIVDIYGNYGGGWLWRMVEGVVGNLDRNECRALASAIFILDINYKILEDRSEESFHRCNSEFLSNCIKCARLAHGWWSPKRYSLIRTAKDFRVKMDEYGYVAWQNNGRIQQP
jgi:hypothetical protein